MRGKNYILLKSKSESFTLYDVFYLLQLSSFLKES